MPVRTPACTPARPYVHPHARPHAHTYKRTRSCRSKRGVIMLCVPIEQSQRIPSCSKTTMALAFKNNGTHMVTNVPTHAREWAYVSVCVPGASKTDENVILTKNTMFFGKTRCCRETRHFRFQAFSHTFLQLVIRSQQISKASSQPQNLPLPSPLALVTKSASNSPLVFRNSNLKKGGRGPK